MSSLNSFTRYGLCIPSSPSPNLDNFRADYICSQGHSLQRDISAQADFAVRHYRETTPVAERSFIEIWNVMTKAQEKTIKSIRARTFEKYISIAHFDNGEDFFHKVSLHHFHISSTMNIHFICVFSSAHFNFVDVHRLIDTLMNSPWPTWQLKVAKKCHLPSRSFFQSQMASLVERPPSWEVGEQVSHRQAYQGEGFGRLASQGVLLGSSTSIPWLSSFWFHSSCFIANHLTHFGWRKKSQSRLKSFKRTSPSTSIGTHPRLFCALVSMLIIGGLSFGTEPSNLTSTISLLLHFPKVITYWSSRRGLWLSSASPIGNAFILHFCIFSSFHFLLVPMVHLPSFFVL